MISGCDKVMRSNEASRLFAALRGRSAPPAAPVTPPRRSRNSSLRPSAALAALAVATLAFAGCQRDARPPDRESGAEPAGIEKTFERGPLEVILRLDNSKPTIADRITLEIEATARGGYEVEFPSFGEKLEQFGIVDYSSTQPELLEDDRVRQSRTYVLEPFLSGEYRIPPMTFRFRKRDGAEEDSHELQTGELTVEVASLLPGEAGKLEIHDIKNPVELPREPPEWLWPAAGGLAALFLAGGLFAFIRRRRGGPPAPPPRPAHEIAFEELEALVAADLPAKGEIKAFYQGISDILRRYIENRFGLRAPERTTEEFLAELGAGQILDPAHKTLLDRFLHHCDLVKFAEHQPRHDDIQNTFDSCKSFILETRETVSTAA